MNQIELTHREAQAVAEVGHTDVSAPVTWLLCLVFLSAIGLTPLVQAVVEYRQRDERGTPWPHAFDLFRILHGVTETISATEGSPIDRLLSANNQLQLDLHDYESQLEDTAWLRSVGLGPTQRVLTKAFRRGTEQVVVGKNDWLYFMPELRSLMAGRFWGTETLPLAHGGDATRADPLPAIVAFHNDLRSQGIDLLFVPVPPKVTVYPEHLVATGLPNATRLDHWHVQFYAELSRHGVNVLDVWPLLVAHRSEEPMFCQTDTHWSGAGVRIVADAIAEHIRDRDWLKEIPRANYRREIRPVEIFGDLARLLDEQSERRETLSLPFVIESAGTESRPVSVWSESPLLLLGDSHTLVFSEPDLHATGAGLAEQLAFALGFGVDVEGARGSGGTAARRSLKRRRDGLQGKRLVIWCFAARELTESADGWPIISFKQRAQ